MSEQLADKIWNIVLEWDYFAKNTIGTQIVKAADSVGANIAEGSGRVQIQSFDVFFEYPAVRFTKRDTG